MEVLPVTVFCLQETVAVLIASVAKIETGLFCIEPTLSVCAVAIYCYLRMFSLIAQSIKTVTNFYSGIIRYRFIDCRR